MERQTKYWTANKEEEEGEELNWTIKFEHFRMKCVFTVPDTDRQFNQKTHSKSRNWKIQLCVNWLFAILCVSLWYEERRKTRKLFNSVLIANAIFERIVVVQWLDTFFQSTVWGPLKLRCIFVFVNHVSIELCQNRTAVAFVGRKPNQNSDH